MKKQLLIIPMLVVAAVLFSCSMRKATPVSSLVDPKIGAVHCRWFFFTPAAVPFGMAKLAPHTNAYGSPGSWLPCGYDDRHNSIEGFGHFHEFQVGGVVVMPATGALKTLPGTLEEPDKGYRSQFRKETEIAVPGYYSVFLDDYKIKAEITATPRVGFHRYTFPKSEQSRILFDVGHRQGESGEVTDAYVKLNDDNTIEGSVTTYPEYAKFCDVGNKVDMYFFAKLNKKPEAVGTFVNDSIQPGQQASHGIDNGLYVDFKTGDNEVVEMQVGLSYTSIANARLNLEMEAANTTFDQVKMACANQWEKMLGRINVSGGKHEDQVKFYTGLYHALLGRGLSSDVNGQYPQNKGGIGQIPLDSNNQPTHQHYNTDGVWGAFWNLGQLWALAYPEYFSNYVQSSIDFYNDNGWLHDGEAAGVYTNGVQTNFMGLMIASAYNSGIRDFDVQKGYEAVVKNETQYENRDWGSGKYDLEYFVKQGYVPMHEFTLPNGWVHNFCASHTLEYCFSSYAGAQMAKSMGKTADYNTMMAQAGHYHNLFDAETKYFRPREKDGSFLKEFSPMKAWVGFQEGNAVQYTWYVPHDVAGLIDLIGSDLFNQRLEETFNEAQKTQFGGGKDLDSFSGVEKLYNHGNQPCLHNSWLFNYSGKPWLTQKFTRAICNEFYGTTPLHGYGFGQDEDQGQLGAWYVMAAMGLFDVQGHTSANPTFQIGSPLFDKIEVQLHPKYYTGKKFTIHVKNNNGQNGYVQSVLLNGEPQTNNWFYREQVTRGGEMTIELGDKPNKNWGVGQMPPSMSNELMNTK